MTRQTKLHIDAGGVNTLSFVVPSELRHQLFLKMTILNCLSSLAETFRHFGRFLPKGVKWKNERAKPNCAYIPTNIEHVANIITHGIWIPPSLYAGMVLLRRSSTRLQFYAAVVYGSALVLCFTVSTVFHSIFYCGKNQHLKDVLHRGDRAMIYVFIAASYFPWVMLRPLPTDSIAAELWWLVWVLAAAGILYQQLFHERYKTLETCFYIFLGAAPSMAVLAQIEHAEFSGIQELMLGGVLYAVGVLFFKSDGTVPCAHAIWHLFVGAAASVHYYAILNHLYQST